MIVHAIGLLAALVSADPQRSETPAIDRLAPRAAGVCLAEVVNVAERDQRGGDGPLYVEVELRILESSGLIEKELAIIREWGGHRARDSSRYPPKPLFSVADAKRGGRWWFAFASRYDWQPRNPPRLIGAWPESDGEAAAAFQAAIRDDRYRWKPQYDSETGFTICHLSEEGEEQWLLRLEKDGKTLWEKRVPGRMAPQTFDLGFYGEYEGFPSHMPAAGKILAAPTLVDLPQMNEFDLPPGKYKLSTAFDPETGRRLAVYVFRTEPGYEKLLYRDYHPTTAALLGEDRFEVQPTGGKALGAEREEWWRKTSRRFEAETGAVISHKRFWYDDRPNVDERWKAID